LVKFMFWSWALIKLVIKKQIEMIKYCLFKMRVFYDLTLKFDNYWGKIKYSFV
jgi:hypothetical protein